MNNRTTRKVMKKKKINYFSQIIEGFRSMLRIWIRELQLILKDVGVISVVFAAPLLYPLLYSTIYYNEVVREMPIAVVDLSHTSTSREFIRKLDATPELKVYANCASMEEAIVEFKSRRVRGVVQIPETFSADIALNRQTTISTYADMEFFMYYKALMAGTSYVTLDATKKIQITNLMNSGLSEREAEVTSEPVKIVDNVMGNKAGGFGNYGVPASLILIIQQTLILAIGIMAGTARERHAFGILAPLDRKRLGTLRLVLGKTAAYFTIYALLSVYMLGMIPQWFGYGRAASFQEMVALITPFLLSSIFFGLTLSVFFKSRESAMMIYVFSSIPILFLSGVIWPLSSFSDTWLAVREIFPSSNAIFGFVKMKSLGASIHETKGEITALWIQTVIYFLTACLAYAYQVTYSERIREGLLKLPFRELRRIVGRR